MSVYACADIHGNGKIWDNIKKFLKEDDTLYFLGDAIDRGEDGWRIFNEMLADPRVIYILGNHELMMRQYLKEILDDDEYTHDAYILWVAYNGGSPTYTALLNDNVEYAKIIKIIDDMPVVEVYRNTEGVDMILSHAGFTPKSFPKNDWDAVWNRKHITTGPWDGYDDLPPFLIVHGHTPVSVLMDLIDEDMPPAESGAPQEYIVSPEGPIWYWNNMKVDIDVGTVLTHQTVLFNLDTYESIIVKEEV